MNGATVTVAVGLVCATALIITGHAAGVWALPPIAAVMRALSWHP